MFKVECEFASFIYMYLTLDIFLMGSVSFGQTVESREKHMPSKQAQSITMIATRW